MLESEHVRHTIKIYINPNHSREDTLAQLQYGIEEESVPFEVVSAPIEGAVKLAWEASCASRLEVGIGLDYDKLVLHYRKLNKEQPLFQISARSPQNQVRAIGANAARLVKKLPFKTVTVSGR